MIKVSDYIMKYLAALGIREVFYVPGGGAMHMNDSLGACEGLTPISMIFEQGAAIAAEAYARVSDGYGACLVTSGPGATNALTGLVGAYIDSIPVIFLSGQVKRDDLIGTQGVRQFGVQEVDILSMVQHHTKYAVQIKEPEDIVYELGKAATLAVTGRPGPVWIDVPLDIQASRIDEASCRHYEGEASAMRYAAGESVNAPAAGRSNVLECDGSMPAAGHEKNAQTSASGICADAVTHVIELLNTAKRPLLYLGHGIRLDHAIAEAKQLYNALWIPVVTSWNGVDLIAEDHPLYVGRPGSVGHRHANLIEHKADLVITIGTRLNLIATGYNYDSFLENATHIMVDIDPAEMEKKSIHPEVKICASAHAFLTALLARIDEVHMDKDVRKAWLLECGDIKRAYPVRIKEQAARDGYVSNYSLIEEISHQMTGNDIYQFTSSGTTVDIAMKVFAIKEGQRAFLTKGLAAMGYDLPACIGSAVAMQHRIICMKDRTDEAQEPANKACPVHGSGAQTSAGEASGAGQVVCVTGDGSVAMNLQELEVVSRLQLPIKLFVSDNSGYSMIYGSQNGNFHRLTGADASSGLTLPNMAAVAAAFGIHAVEIADETHLSEQIAEVLGYPGPVVCRVNTDIEQKILPRQANYMREDGQMASRPLYDMTPFVDPEELSRVIK